MTLLLFRTGFVAFVCSLVLCPLMMRLGAALGAMDVPEKRKLHRVPVPRSGGPAIFAAFALGAASAMDFTGQSKAILAGSLMVFVVGLMDDMNGISAQLRLAVQTAAALAAVVSGVSFRLIGVAWLDAALTVVWILWMINALNFLDNMDWLATGIAMVACFFFFILAMLTGDRWLGYLVVPLFGACLGFSYFNLPPARLFMGDAGSTFMGYLLACVAVLGEWSDRSRTVGIAVPVLVLYVMIFDMILITVLRIAEGKVRNVREWIEYAGTDHLSHRLVAMFGMSRLRATAAIVYACLLLGGTAVFVYARHSAPAAGAVLAALGAGSLAFMLRMKGVWMRGGPPPPPDGREPGA